MEKEYAKQSLLVLMLGLALFMGFTVGYHYNKIDTYNLDGKIRNVNWLESYNNQQEYIFKTLKDTSDGSQSICK